MVQCPEEDYARAFILKFTLENSEPFFNDYRIIILSKSVSTPHSDGMHITTRFPKIHRRSNHLKKSYKHWSRRFGSLNLDGLICFILKIVQFGRSCSVVWYQTRKCYGTTNIPV